MSDILQRLVFELTKLAQLYLLDGDDNFQTGNVIWLEAMAQGADFSVGFCVNLLRHPYARFRVDVKVTDDVLHEVYLPHFRRIVEGVVVAVMATYNSVNGEWAG
ncbi:hypothetical protein VTI74DRAFT_1665 [Chaetomium olivicolor]